MASSELHFRKVCQAGGCEDGFEERRLGDQSPRPDFGGRRGSFSSQDLEAAGVGG